MRKVQTAVIEKKWKCIENALQNHFYLFRESNFSPSQQSALVQSVLGMLTDYRSLEAKVFITELCTIAMNMFAVSLEGITGPVVGQWTTEHLRPLFTKSCPE
jgi:hypothetical protein